MCSRALMAHASTATRELLFIYIKRTLQMLRSRNVQLAGHSMPRLRTDKCARCCTPDSPQPWSGPAAPRPARRAGQRSGKLCATSSAAARAAAATAAAHCSAPSMLALQHHHRLQCSHVLLHLHLHVHLTEHLPCAGAAGAGLPLARAQRRTRLGRCP